MEGCLAVLVSLGNQNREVFLLVLIVGLPEEVHGLESCYPDTEQQGDDFYHLYPFPLLNFLTSVRLSLALQPL